MISSAPMIWTESIEAESSSCSVSLSFAAKFSCKKHLVLICFVLLLDSIWFLEVFIIISSFMMLNMLLGILVEVVANTAEGRQCSQYESFWFERQKVVLMVVQFGGFGHWCYCRGKEQGEEHSCETGNGSDEYKWLPSLQCETKFAGIETVVGDGCRSQRLGRGKWYIAAKIYAGSLVLRLAGLLMTLRLRDSLFRVSLSLSLSLLFSLQFSLLFSFILLCLPNRVNQI